MHMYYTSKKLKIHIILKKCFQKFIYSIIEYWKQINVQIVKSANQLQSIRINFFFFYSYSSFQFLSFIYKLITDKIKNDLFSDKSFYVVSRWYLLSISSLHVKSSFICSKSIKKHHCKTCNTFLTSFRN